MTESEKEYLYLEYHWEDDQNQGNNIEAFIGTWSEFQDYVENLQQLWGFNYWNLKIRPATKEEIERIEDLEMTKKERNYLNNNFFKVEIKEKATDLKFVFHMNMNYILSWLMVYNGDYEMRIYDTYDPIKKDQNTKAP